MQLIEKVTVPEGKRGAWQVERFEIPKNGLAFLYKNRAPTPGTYTRLTHGTTCVMSDVPAEMRDHYEAVHQAKGHILINGLGLGMVLAACLKKREVTKATVIEIDKDVIDLVAPHYANKRVEVICANAYEYKPPKGIRYGMVWHDIWSYICADNLEGMKKLHRKYGRVADWQGSWCRYQCERGL
jgi:hypothetical protein